MSTQKHAEPHAFYAAVLERLKQDDLPFTVGGAFALFRHTGVERNTKDLDLFVLRRDVPRILGVFEAEGYRAELTYPHWLAKIYDGKEFVDLIFNSGNGVASVDEAFFTYSDESPLFGVRAPVCPAEEMIWTKAFVMERERYDGADIAHLIYACAETLDWARLVDRFGAHYPVLLQHLVMFGYVYPHARAAIPRSVLELLMERVRADHAETPEESPVCAGTLLSREQYLVDVEHWGHMDGRLAHGVMSPAEIAVWTSAIQRRSP